MLARQRLIEIVASEGTETVIVTATATEIATATGEDRLGKSSWRLVNAVISARSVVSHRGLFRVSKSLA